MNLRITTAALTALLWAASGPALAADAKCLWDNLTPATRDAMTRADREHGGDAFAHVAPTDADGAAVMAGCGADAASEDSLQALREYVGELGAAAWLAQHRGIPLSRLEGAWAALPVVDRTAVQSAAAGAVEGDAVDDAVFDVFDRLSAALGLGDNEARMQAFTWSFRRALRQAYERRGGGVIPPRPQV